MKSTFLIGITIFALALIVTLSGCTGIALTCEDRSRQQLERCNTDCGEGLGSELCKTGCTNEHNQRLEQCKEISP